MNCLYRGLLYITRVARGGSIGMSGRIDSARFAVDVMLMQMPRALSHDMLVSLCYPLSAPLYVRDWTEFLPQIMAPMDLIEEDYASPARVRSLVLQGLYSSGCILSRHVGQGFHSPSMRPAPGPAPASAKTIMAQLGACMNMASNLKDSLAMLQTPLGDVYAACFILGQHIAWLCADHEYIAGVFKRLRSSPPSHVAPYLVLGAGACGVPVNPIGKRAGERDLPPAQGDAGLPPAIAAGEQAADPGSPRSTCILEAQRQVHLSAGGPPATPEGTNFAFLEADEGHWGPREQGAKRQRTSG